jgi:hypothetical protein
MLKKLIQENVKETRCDHCEDVLGQGTSYDHDYGAVGSMELHHAIT